jgi:predicted Fe-Mo cluster-binding NifX family protein
MRICLACYQNRLAALFETASEFRIFEIADDEICSAGRLPLPSRDPMDRISTVTACGATLLLCGGMGRHLRQVVERSGIRVRAWLSGSVDDVLEALANGRLEALATPGAPADDRP